MMQSGLVSIITPCYNGEKYISETIESVIAQTYPNWEMIIIDDGSKDNSLKIALEYAQKDNRISVFQQSNGGSASARNNGIRRSNGQYIALLDADDLWLPDFLENQIAFMIEKNAICVYCSYSRIDEKSKNILRPIKCKPEVTIKDMMITNRIGCLSGLYDSKRYGKIYLHEELKSIRDDYAYWIDIVKLEGIAYGNPKIMAKYRILPNSTTGKKGKLIKKQYFFYRKYLNLSMFRSIINTVSWGWYGIIKFIK